jgi:hypothetical protein
MTARQWSKHPRGAPAIKVNLDGLEQTQWPVLPFTNFSGVVNIDYYVGDRTCQTIFITARSVVLIGDEIPSCAPAFLRNGAAPCSDAVSNNPHH